MDHRSPARWLAPLALLGSVAAILIVVAASGGGSSDDAVTVTTAAGGSTAAEARTGTSTTPAHADAPRFYVVKDGDVLSAIADATGVPLSEIEQLNPDVDAQSLHTGQRIKLRP